MISNSTPLIFLSKIGKLTLLKKVFGEVIIPAAVQKEVLVESKPGYAALQEALAEKWIKVRTPRKILELSLGPGESEALSLAREIKDSLLLDDAYAIKAAHIYGVETMRTTSILFLAAQHHIIKEDELVRLLNELVGAGYYIRPSEYALLLSKIQNTFE